MGKANQAAAAQAKETILVVDDDVNWTTHLVQMYELYKNDVTWLVQHVMEWTYPQYRSEYYNVDLAIIHYVIFASLNLLLQFYYCKKAMKHVCESPGVKKCLKSKTRLYTVKYTKMIYLLYIIYL